MYFLKFLVIRLIEMFAIFQFQIILKFLDMIFNFILYISELSGGHEKLVLWFTNNAQIPGRKTLPDDMFTEVTPLILRL